MDTLPPQDRKRMRKKHDQELIELLNELRVVLPGAQVLFAFLLVAPFSSRAVTGDAQKIAYMIALLATLLGTVLLIAPSAYHRLRWREKNKERMLRISNQLAVAGIGAIATAMTASVFLVTDTLYSRTVTIVVTVGSGALFLFGWYVLPLSTPYDRWDEPDEDGEPEEVPETV